MSDIVVERITDASGAVLDAAGLAAAEPVHRQLRPQIPAPYPASMAAVFRGGGRMIVARQAGEIAGVGVFRIIDNTHMGRKLYVDDLVTDERRRSSGVGHAMLEWLEAEARRNGCKSFELDSGTHRQQAHKFYFREGFTVVAFAFQKPLA
jgi:GNAT superfamily N-acetyltransferase